MDYPTERLYKAALALMIKSEIEGVDFDGYVEEEWRELGAAIENFEKYNLPKEENS